MRGGLACFRGGAFGGERAITILSAMVGGLTLARATAKSNPDLSAEILESVRMQLAQLAETTP